MSGTCVCIDAGRGVLHEGHCCFGVDAVDCHQVEIDAWVAARRGTA